MISQHRSALNRQVREAVRIQRRGGAGLILNSKAEYSRCYIPRLVIEKEDEEEKRMRMEIEQQRKDDLVRNLKDMDETWEQRKDTERMKAEKKREG